ncbi:hypothetical protein KC973_00115 [Candidatus Saccharibacteria bacterium]|nr:hypothetical protein [Candidatus Saccharibacteria bacterium]
MTAATERLPQDVTEELTFDEASRESVDALLKYGVVVTRAAVDHSDLEGLRVAVDTMFFETIHRRLYYKALEQRQDVAARQGTLQKHSMLSQFDPNDVPDKLSPVSPALETLLDLDAQFFEDDRLQFLYADRAVRPNVVNVSRATPRQVAFEKHQDSVNVCRLGHAVHTTDTWWTIVGGEAPSRHETDQRFLVEAGSVVTLLERAGDKPKLDRPGQGSVYFLEDGSEVHAGENATDETRYRIALFAHEVDYELLPWESRRSDIFTNIVVSAAHRRRLRARV